MLTAGLQRSLLPTREPIGGSLRRSRLPTASKSVRLVSVPVPLLGTTPAAVQSSSSSPSNTSPTFLSPRASSSHSVLQPSVLSSSTSSSSDEDARDMSTSLSLTNIRNALIRQEDTIIFNFIERAQFARNEVVYQSNAIPVPGFDTSGRRYSLLEYLLRATEQLHGSVRRYTSPDEHAFYPDDQPTLVLPPLSYPSVLAPCARSVNLNAKIMEVYLNQILPGITSPGDDNNHGSASTLDVLVLQALSKRIHYGKFVAEAKFRADPEGYTRLIKARDSDAIMALLTDVAVEKKVIERVRLKAATFGQDITPEAAASSASIPSMSVQSSTPPAAVRGDGHSLAAASAAGSTAGVAGSEEPRRYKVSPDVVAEVYERVVMPLTKEVEVEYLLRRLD